MNREIPMDRISNLPRELISSILDRMPTEDAFKTSALSRQWRYNWTTTSILNFDDLFWWHLQKTKSLHSNDIFRIITNLLLLHSSPVESFTLCTPNICTSQMREIDNMILILSKKAVKEFNLRIWHINDQEIYRLPSYFYPSLAELQHLKLHKCYFKPPSSFQVFPNLVSLDLSLASFDKESLELFISRSPLLERLCVSNMSCDQLHISSPSLKELQLESHTLKSIRVNAENLRKLSASQMGASNPGFEVSVVTRGTELLGTVPVIETLSLGGYSVKFVASDGVQTRGPTPLMHVKKLKFDDFDFGSATEILAAISVIESAPNLQKLKFVTSDFSLGDGIKSVSKFVRPDCSIHRLQSATFVLSKGSRTELEMMKSILAAAASLKKMVIRLRPRFYAKRGANVLKKLLNSSRASSNPEIICVNEADQ